MHSSDIQRLVDRLLTVQDLCRRFDVTAMTINHWRNRETGKLPSVVIKGDRRPSIRFVPSDVSKWARVHLRRKITPKELPI